MSDFQTLLNQYSGGSVLEEKQNAVARAALQKQARLGGMPTQADYTNAVVGGQNDVGTASASPLEYELRTLTPFQLAMKYGEGTATQLNNGMVDAASGIQRKLAVERSPGRAVGDTVTEILSGAANGIAGIGVLGLGIIDKTANTLNSGVNAGLGALGSSFQFPTSNMGVNAAQAIGNINKAVAGTESDTLQNRNEILAIKNNLTARDNTQVMDQEIAAGGDSAMAGLKRIGNDFLDAVDNATDDPTTFMSGTAQGIGSLLAAGPIAKGITLAGTTAGRVSGLLTEAAARVAPKMATGAVPLSIGAMEAGGAYQQTANAAMEKLASRTDLSQEEKQQLANDTALKAASWVAPAAILAGKLVAPFEANPLSKVGLKTAAGNILKEPIEEGMQGATGQLAQNLATQQNIDPTQSLTQGVGEQAGVGALYGLGTAGVLQVPAVGRGTVEAAVKTAGSVIGGVTNYLVERGDKWMAETEAAGPASINRAVEQSAALVQTGPALKAEVEQALAPVAEDSPEVVAAKATAMADFPGFIDALNIQETELQSRLLQPVATVIAGAKTRPEAITAILADMKQEKDPRVYFEKAVALQALIDTALIATEKLNGIDDTLLPPSVAKLFQSVAGIGDSLINSPEVKGHLAQATKILQSPVGIKLMSEMQQTPESAQTIVAAAQIDPTAVNPAVAGVVLKMAQSGELVLTETQTKSLKAAKGMMESAQAFDAELLSQDVPKLRDIVSVEIKTEDDPGKDTQGTRSALQHARNIASLAIRGDMAGAKAALGALGNFAQGQSNKVTGINQHYAAGKGAPHVSVKVASFKGGMTDIKTPVGVTPTKEGSINHAKRVTAEARFLTNMHNLLNETYNLGVTPLPIVELDAALADGRTADIVADFNNGKRGYPQQQTLTSAAVTPAVIPPATTVVTPATPVVKAKKERKPKAVKEPKPLKISKAVKASKTAKLQERLNTEKRPAILEQIKAELALRENTPTPEIPSVTQTPEAIQAKPSQAPQEATSPATTATAPVAVTLKVAPTETTLTATPAEYGEAVRVRDSSNEADLDNASERTLQLVQALNDDVKINVMPTVKVTPVNTPPAPTKKVDSKSVYAEKAIALLLTKEKALDAADSGSIDPASSTAAEYTAEVEFKQALQKVVKASGEFINRVQRFGTNYALRLQDKQDALSAELKDSEGVTDTDTAISLLRDVVAYMAEHEAKQGQLFDEAQTTTETKKKVDATSILKQAVAPVVSASVAPKVVTPAAPVITPTIVPNAHSVTGQAIAATSVVTPPATPKTVEEAYPKLLNQGETSFSKAFSLRKNLSRFFGSVSPIETLTNALSSTEAMIAFVGSTTTKHSLTPLAQIFYRETLPDLARKIVDTLEKRLTGALTGTGDLASKSPLGDLFINPTMSKKGELNIPQDMVRGRVFNIAEMGATGTPVYNKELLESAVLGSLSWFMTSGNDGPKYDNSDLAALGITTDGDSDGLLNEINNGGKLLKLDVISRMAAYITDFWGMKPNNDFSQTATVGIPQAVASEILKAMQKAGLVIVSEIPRPDGGHGIETFTLNHDVLGKDYTSYPSFLGEMANSEIPEAMYFGEERPPVRTTQMGSSFVDLTEDQEQMVRNANDVVHQLNMPVVNMYKALGKDRMLDLFGVAYLDENSRNLYNAEHLESIEGNNLSIVGAYESLMGRVDAVTSAADAVGVAVGDLAIRMPHEVAKNGRLFMRGAYNEQASKVTREAMMPTRAVLDLSDETMLSNYMASLAQMLGVKVHNLTRVDAVNKATGIFNDALDGAVQVMSEFLTTGEFTNEGVATIKEFLHGVGDTNMALHALLEYAGYLEAKGIAGNSPLTEHVSNIYMEADGVANGPTNAMLLFSTGTFTEANLINMAKGGMFFTPGMTMNIHRGDKTNPNRDKVDLYQDGASNLKEEIEALKQDLALNSANTEPSEHLDSLLRLMQEFLGDISLDENNNIQINRGTIKNPMMITIYGSGINGIAGNILEELLQAIYVRMSEALQAQNDRALVGEKLSIADAMFVGKDPSLLSTEARYKRFVADFGKLTKKKVVYNKKDEQYQAWNHKTDSGVYSDYVVLPSANSTNYVQALKSFKIKGAEWGSMRENMALLFVKPMRNAINTSLGSDVLAASKLIQTATNVQSLAMQFAFKEAVTEAMAKSGRRGGMYISKNEQAAVMKELIKKFPMIANAGQQFLIAKSSQSTVSAAAFSASLAGDLQMMALVNAPAASGVAGGPAVVIGYGDSLMMQTHSLMDGAVKNVLRIFDGMHMPVDKIMEGSRQINEAVHKTWQNNPLRDVATSFKKARPAIDSAIYPDFDKGTGILDMEDSDALMRALNLRPESTTTVEEALNAIQAELDNAADQHEARIVAMSKFAQSIDQMAGAGASYQYAGKDISMLTLEAQAAILEEERKQALVRIKARHKAQTTNSEELKGRHSEPAARITYTFEGMLTEIRKLPADLQETAKQALRSPAMRDYIIVVASADDINAETGGLLGSSNGVTDVENKRIYIASTNPEVWVHELVHAATYEKVQGVLNGTNKDKVTIAAVERLQALRDQFKIMSSDQVTWTIEQVRAYREATNSMATALQEYGEAAELNELMAWTTTNSALIEVGKQTKATFRAFEKITRAVVNTIRRIFFGSSPDKLPRDFFNAVRFNTALIATRSQPTATEEMQSTILRHTNSYGNDARLNQLESTYVSLVEPLFQGVNNLLQKTNVNYYASNLVTEVETAFPMSHQERSTFHTIVAALATEAKINPASIAKAQELYNHVTKQLEVEDFMSNPELQDPVDRYYAQEKYDVIMGKTGSTKDSYGRSSLMPVFLALASTNDDFRRILSKMDMPKGTKNLGTTLDVYLRNTGTQIMEMLSNQLSGVKSTDSVRQAIDNLQNNIMAIAAEKATVLDSLSNKFSNLVDNVNDYAVEKLGNVAVAGVALGDKMKKSNIKAVSTAGSIVRVLSGSLSDKTSAFMAEGMLSAMNSRNGLQPLRDFANDMLGRVASNANIYDMIKQVRSTVAAVRQEFRENVPTKLAKTFKTVPTDEVWTELTRAMGKTDMAALDMPFTDIVELVRNKAQTAREIKSREDAIRTEAGNATLAATYLLKSAQLAKFMKTGIVGNNLYRNAPAIALKVGGVFAASSPSMVKNIDELVSLYALRDMEQNERNAFNSLAQDEGLEFTFMYLKQQRADETAKALQHKGSKLNHYKGYIPSVQSSGMSLIVADDSQDAQLKAMSYVRVGDYNGAGAEGSVVRRGYYFNNAPTRGTFNQGIMQNVNITANGVDAVHGFTQGLTAGVITDPIYVAKLFKRINAGAEKGTNEHLMPILDDLGGVIAYERSVDPVQLERLQSNNKLHQMLGVWRGRQIEEAMANEINNKLVDNMVEMYQKASASDRKTKYVNIFDPKDKVLADALKLMPADVRDYMKASVVNPDEFWVRRDMVFDAFGYRTASVGDAWTGNSRWSPETQKVFQKVAIGFMGNQAFSILLKGEKFTQGFMADARTTIVVKSMIVPALNLISTLGQLVARGVPVLFIAHKAPTKIAEIESYVRSNLRKIDADAELRAAKTTNEILKLKAEIQSLEDAQHRLTIWPLIEAGEFTAISDVGLIHDDIDLSQGRWHQYVEKLVDKLPEPVRNAGRYAYITKDTALFQGLQKAVQYGDFLGKSLLYDYMVNVQKKTPVEALARITEEFVNYDRLPGRFRGYLEQMGMLWFYNFKLRSVKVAASLLRNNPVHALMSNFLPVFGDAGSVLTENVLAKVAEGTLGWSIGPGMGLGAPLMNPVWQLSN